MLTKKRFCSGRSLGQQENAGYALCSKYLEDFGEQRFANPCALRARVDTHFVQIVVLSVYPWFKMTYHQPNQFR